MMDVKEIQTILGVEPVDGIIGPATTAALVAAAKAGRVTVGPVPVSAPDKVPAADIPASGHARLDRVHRDLVAVVTDAAARCNVPFTVIEGSRTAARQKELVARGASKTMRSRHLTGHAVDLWPLDPVTGKALPSGTPAAEARLWADLRIIADAVKAAAAARGVSVEWGGDWASFPDGPHFQLTWAAYPAV